MKLPVTSFFLFQLRKRVAKRNPPLYYRSEKYQKLLYVTKCPQDGGKCSRLWALPSFRRGEISCDLSDGLWARPEAAPGPESHLLPGAATARALLFCTSPGSGGASLDSFGAQRQSPRSGDGADVCGDAKKQREIPEASSASALSAHLGAPQVSVAWGTPAAGRGGGSGGRRDPRAGGGRADGCLMPQPVSFLFSSARPIGRSVWILRKPEWALRSDSRTLPCRP